MSEDPFFEIEPRNRPAFVRYLMDPFASVPNFVMNSKMRSEIGLARGNLLESIQKLVQLK